MELMEVKCDLKLFRNAIYPKKKKREEETTRVNRNLNESSLFFTLSNQWSDIFRHIRHAAHRQIASGALNSVLRRRASSKD